METTSQMKTVIALLGLSASVALAADVSEKNLPVAAGVAPTDYIRVVTNNVSAKASPATLATILGGGSQVWTNDGTEIRLADQTNKLDLTTVPNPDAVAVYGAYQIGPNGYPSFEINTVNPQTNSFPIGLWVQLSGNNPDNAFAIEGQLTQRGDTGAVNAAVYGNVNPTVGSIDKGAAVGVLGQGRAWANLQYGVAGIAGENASITNVGVSGHIYAVDDTKTNTALAGFILSASYPWVDLPIFESTALLLDVGSSDVPLVIGRTNNGATVFRVEKTGKITGPGFSSGLTTNQVIGTITLHITNGVIMDITNP